MMDTADHGMQQSASQDEASTPWTVRSAEQQPVVKCEDTQEDFYYQQQQQNGGFYDRTRCDRNSREQKRSAQISDQIQTLRSILANAGIQSKSSKYSVLSSSAEYIRRLQCRSDELEEERARFEQQSIDKKNRTTKKPRLQPQQPEKTRQPEDCPEAPTTAGIDFKLVFACASLPLGICGLDGRFVDVNHQFVSHSGYSAAELKQLTLFNLTNAEEIQQTYARISNLLNSTASRCEVRAVLRNATNVDSNLSITLVQNSGRGFESFLVSIVHVEQQQQLPPYIP